MLTRPVSLKRKWTPNHRVHFSKNFLSTEGPKVCIKSHPLPGLWKHFTSQWPQQQDVLMTPHLLWLQQEQRTPTPCLPGLNLASVSKLPPGTLSLYQRSILQRLCCMYLSWNSQENFSLVSSTSLGISWKNKIKVMKVFPKVAQVHYGPENDDNILQNTLRECK